MGSVTDSSPPNPIRMNRLIGLGAGGIGQAKVGASGGHSMLTLTGVKRGRRSLEELALGGPEIRTVLQRPDLRNNGLQGVEGKGALLADEPNFAVGLLDCQLGALLSLRSSYDWRHSPRKAAMAARWARARSTAKTEEVVATVTSSTRTAAPRRAT